MRFYGSGEKGKPVIFLFPGTCCLWTSFDHVLEELHKSFYTVVVSYDGFDPKEKTEFSSMLEECEKIEAEVRKNYGGKIKAAYGCSLGGSFVALLIQRKKITIEHGIIGSSDMDEAGPLLAKLESAIMIPILYPMVKKGELSGWMYQVKCGATTTWERWDALKPDGTVNEEKMAGSGDNMVSFNHYAFGSVGEFYYQYILGIKPQKPGFAELHFEPYPDRRPFSP